MKLVSPGTLRRLGVLGINARNHRYMQRWNERALFPVVDDKISCKDLAERHGIATPRMLHVFHHHGDLRRWGDSLERHEDFVIKPARGCAGKGILVVTGRRGARHRVGGGRSIDAGRVRHHLANILNGLFSLGGRPDRAFVEERVEFSDCFAPYVAGGVPDVRLLVFRGYPIMAMMRLGTERSEGRGNLHQGAVGVGLDLRRGTFRSACLENLPVCRHPDTQQDLAELQVPAWDEHLEMAARCYEMTGLGYFGVDIVLERGRRPLMLEVNARPGLGIQIANRCGLTPLLEAVAARRDDPVPPPDERIAIARELFDRHGTEPGH